MKTTEASQPTAWSNFQLKLAPPCFATALLPESPFGINMAMSPETPNVETRLKLMQQAGMKWGRQDFTWRRIEREKGVYDMEPYERHLELCRKYGMLLFGNLSYNPPFHDPRTPQGVDAYCAYARAVVKRFQGRIDHWQIWNEPNGGFWKGTPEEFARLFAAGGKAIHEANPRARVLGLNMAFCDVVWAERILKQVPFDCFDIACFHPYRQPSGPEEHFDWWLQDLYVKAGWHKGEVPEPFPLVRMNLLEQTDELIKLMRRFGEPKPCWVTEISWSGSLTDYGTPELRQADVIVRFHLFALASRKIEKIFPYTLIDTGKDEIAGKVSFLRPDLQPKYSYHAYSWMTRMLEGKRWVRNDEFGPDVYAAVFTDDEAGEDTIVAWTTQPYAFIRVNNEKGLTFYDLYGTRRIVPANPSRPPRVSVPLSGSATYVVGPKGLKAVVRPDPGW